MMRRRSQNELTLTPRERRILGRRDAGVFLRDIAPDEGISANRVRMIEIGARQRQGAEWTPKIQWDELLNERS